MEDGSLGYPLFAFMFMLGSTLFVMLIIREVVCWYWKINEIVRSLKAIREASEATLETQRRLLAALTTVSYTGPVPEAWAPVQVSPPSGPEPAGYRS